MPEINSIENIYFLIFFIVPGLVIMSVRNQFITGMKILNSENVLSFFVVTVIYYAAASPLSIYLLREEGSILKDYIYWIGGVIFIPVVVGIILGIIVQNDVLHSIMRKLGLNPVHAMPTAWDWIFKNMSATHVLVVLKDGTKFAGFCGEASFMSSVQNERDMYIEKVYDIDENNQWHLKNKGVFISAGEVRTIEIWHPE